MNPESTNPQEELEIRMVALLLGELSEAEAAELEAKITADPALQMMRDRLAATLGLVREAALSPLENSGAPMEAMKLSAAKREKLLATFKTMPLPVVAKTGEWKRYAPLGLAAALVGVVSLAVFRFGKLGMSSSDSYAPNYQGSADLAPVQWADSEKRESAGGVYPGKVVGFGVTTNAVGGGFGRTPPRESSELVLSYDFAQPAGAPLPTTASGPLAEKPPVQQPLSRNESLAFQNDGAQRGGQAGQTWEFYAKDANGPLGESLVVAGQVDSLATVNGPATADGTKSFFRSIQAADTLSAAGAATGDRTASASATPRSYFDDQLGRKPNADLPVLSDQPMAGRLFREPAVAGVPITGLAEESELKRTEATANRSQLVSQAETASRWFGGLAGGARGGVEAVSAPANVPPPDVQVHARFSEMAQTDAKSVDFDKSLGNAVQAKVLFDDASTAGKSESVAGVNGMAVDGLRDLSAKADAKPLADESRFGFKAGLAKSEALVAGQNPGAVSPSSASLAVPPSRDVLDRVGEPKERGDTPVALGSERGERSQVREMQRDEGLERAKKPTDDPALPKLAKNLAEREQALAQLEDLAPAKQQAPAPVPQPEVVTAENAFSTFSLNVSDVSFKLAAASLEQGRMPEAASIRAEEFLNAFDYRDPLPMGGAPVAFAWDRARSPFEHNRDLLRLSLRTAAAGRSAAQPLNLVLLLDNSGSMERADRVGILREALKVLAGQLRPEDRLSVVTFARTALLRADGVDGSQAAAVFGQLEGVVPEGGTNLEEAMGVAYATARRHFLAQGVNRVVLLTDGAANLGNVEPESLKRVVETNRKQGVALDCFGVGWEGFNDDLLETLSRNGDGRYGFLNSPEEAATNFAQQLAGALQVAVSDVKVQVEFNPKRVTAHRQIGYAKHQLTKEQFRDNTVDAAEIGAAEAGNALYMLAVNPQGEGPLATVRVRFKVPGTQQYREQAWEVPFNGAAPALEMTSPSMRLAASAGAFAEWLAGSPFAAEVKPEALARLLQGVPETFGADGRAKTLAEMVSAAGRLAQ